MAAAIIIMTLAAAAALCILTVAGFRKWARANWWEGPPKSYTKCGTCRGTGAQWLNGKHWAVIPEHLRDRQADRQFHPPLANVRACISCHGTGILWSREGHRQ